MTERLASDILGRLLGVIRLYAENNLPTPVRGLPSLQKLIISARELARETEEELLIAELRIAELVHQVKSPPRRELVDIDQEGNVVRLPFQPRIIRTVNPSGGDAA